MPKCNKCKKEFPASVVVDGAIRNLRHRKRCLDCYSDFEKRNRVRCTTCKRTFWSTVHANDVECADCRNNARRRALKTRAIMYMGGGCWHCGYNRTARALHFHHVQGEKDFVIASTQNWERVLVELSKCVLVCANCHAEIHDGRLEITDVARREGFSNGPSAPAESLGTVTAYALEWIVLRIVQRSDDGTTVGAMALECHPNGCAKMPATVHYIEFSLEALRGNNT